MAASRRPRVFLDTNVIYSAIHSPGNPPARILALHAGGDIRAVVSQQVLAELVQTVRNKLAGGLDQLRTVLITAPPEVADNPTQEEVQSISHVVNFKDAPIVAAAMSCGADYFVSGDRRLLEECHRLDPPLRALSPREFMDELSRD
ncbi:MAG: putative toxin-antitoxin system toxin component, PIN family [Dehalococcoidia bacterium]|nr:putative toxin-antitoxin system toxin component, PIN family [Dehalococcoidia bacterium]